MQNKRLHRVQSAVINSEVLSYIYTSTMVHALFTYLSLCQLFQISAVRSETQFIHRLALCHAPSHQHVYGTSLVNQTTPFPSAALDVHLYHQHIQ